MPCLEKKESREECINDNQSPISQQNQTKKPLIKVLKITYVILILAALLFLLYKAGLLQTTSPVAGPINETEAVETTFVVAPEPEAGTIQVSPNDGMPMVYVPSGDFTMGSPEGMGYNDEHPQHAVYLSGFWIDQTEVTNAMYAQCVAEEGCTPPGAVTTRTRASYFGNAYFDLYPVVNVSWDQSQAYCAWVGRRLPTEAEWEKAARGTDEREYPWGHEFNCENGNFDDETNINRYIVTGGPNCDGYGDTSPVGSFPTGASPYGALDMAGNVFEWLSDWYAEDYYASQNEWINPQGPTDGEKRVVRSGSPYGLQYLIRSVSRNAGYPSEWYVVAGFRCALSANEIP